MVDLESIHTLAARFMVALKIQRHDTAYYCVSANTNRWSGMCLVRAVPHSLAIVTLICNGHLRFPQKQQQARSSAKCKETQLTLPDPPPSVISQNDIKGEIAPSDRYHQHQQSGHRVKDRNKRKQQDERSPDIPHPSPEIATEPKDTK